MGCKILINTQTKIKAHTLYQVWESQVTYVGHVLTYVYGCIQHWWPLLCGISTLAFSHSTCRNHHGYKIFYIVKCTFHALLCQWKVPSQLWMPRHCVHLWHIVLWWWVICAHHIANGRRAYVSASLWCTVATPQAVQESNGQLLLWFGVVRVSIIFYISNLCTKVLLKLQWHGT